MIPTQISMIKTIMCHEYYAYTLKTIGLYFAYKTVQFTLCYMYIVFVQHIFTRIRKYVNTKCVWIYSI